MFEPLIFNNYLLICCPRLRWIYAYLNSIFVAMWFFVCLHNWKWNVIVLDDLDWHLKVSYRFVNIWLTSCFPRDATYNYVIKRLQDMIALSLYRLVQFHLMEIRRGLCGQGDYRLHGGLQMVTSNIVPTVVTTRMTLLHVYATVRFMTRSSRMISSSVASSSQSMLPMLPMLLTDFGWMRSHRDP